MLVYRVLNFVLKENNDYCTFSIMDFQSSTLQVCLDNFYLS